MKWYPWLTAPYKALVAPYASGRGHHAVLLHTPEQYGEPLLVNAVGRWLMCMQPQGEKTCGHCRGCQLMAAGNHPDWYELAPENNKVTFGVEQIRQLTDKLYTHSQQGGVKVIWLANAERLTVAAANALLKTLEEPPSKTYFLLGCHEPGRLLATIRSRCLYLPLSNPDENYSRQWLAKNYSDLSPSTVTTALRLSSGSPLKAFNLLDSRLWQQRVALCSALENMVQQRDLLILLPALNQDNVIERLDWVMTFFMDAIKNLQGSDNYMTNLDQLPLINQLVTLFNGLSLQNIVQQWLVCRSQLLTVAGINKELLLTNLLLQIESRYLMTNLAK